MPQWNKMQEKAIYTQDKNVLISASAGSGKTTVLVARLLHLVQNKKVEIDRILAMTFTEAAANEMKKRMAKELTNAYNHSADEEEKQYLNKQLANLSNSYISTIHGFCLNIIQNYYYIIKLKKERVNSIMDDAKSADILQRSMDFTFTHFMNDDTFLELRIIFSGQGNSDLALKESILSLFYLSNAKSDPISFLRNCKQTNDIESFVQYPTIIKQHFFDFLDVQCESIHQACSLYLHIAKEENEEKALKIVEPKLLGLNSAMDAIKKQDYSSFRSAFLMASKQVLPNIKAQEETKNLKKQCEDLEAKLHTILFEEKDFLSFTNKNRVFVNKFSEVCEYFLQTYNEIKVEDECIDFFDMEHFALKILQAENGLIASLYREQFYEIMVDEFQDSNDVQDQLVKLICKDNNVFRVGDIKQSIYGFRHASPEIMRSLINNQNELDEIIYLNSNYRSKKSIVEFNNTLFTTLMNINGLQSSFLENDNTNCGLDSQEENNTPIHFHMLDDKAINLTLPHALKSDELKSSYIAHQISKMLQQGYSYRDFAVLIKTNAKSEPLRDAFEEANIPYFINMKHGFYDSSAIMNVLTFLKTLQNPNDDLSFVAFLLSPFIQKQEEEVAQAKLKKNHQSFYDYFKNDSDLTLFHKIKQTMNTQLLSNTLRQIFSVKDYYEQYTTIQEQANLDKLYEIVCNYENQSYLTLPQFLEIIEQAKNAQIGEAIPIGNDDDVVRIMSIHQSKGLQFPVVFLYSTNTINLMDTQGIVSFDDTIKIAMNHIQFPHRFVYPTIERIALNHKLTKAALEEEIRVLYVATTRAQNEMYIVDCGKKEQRLPINKVELYKKKGFTSWILQSFVDKIVPHLYEETYIDSLWENVSQTKITKPMTSLRRYDIPYVEHTINSPSDNEVLSYRPRAFSFDDEYAMERGTNLHKMVEILPGKHWSVQLIKDYAQQRKIQLTSHDYDILVALGNNETFHSLAIGEVFHEFPFMVKVDNIITHGYMDFVSIQKDKVYMVDFKSDKNIDVNTLKQRYLGQIHAYHEALQVLYPSYEVQSYIYSFELNTFINVSK